jgi:RimJ/RimL family protein N-acetyltransferase
MNVLRSDQFAALFSVRTLTANDSKAYRILRQHILDIGDGYFFADSFLREKLLHTEVLWREWCTERDNHCIFGIFAADELVGVMMITQFSPLGERTVEWEATWLDPRYRGCGMAKPAYQRVHKWSVDHGYDCAVVFIRADNTRSQDIRKKQGFRYFYTKHDEVWADGSVADTLAFTLDLRPQPLQQRPQRTLRHLEETQEFLQKHPPHPLHQFIQGR